MTRKGFIIYLVISLILAFIASSLHIILLYPVFFIFDVVIYHVIKSFFPKEDGTSKIEDQYPSAHSDEKKKLDHLYFPKKDTELKIKKCTGNCSTCERDTCIEEQNKP